MPSTVHYRFESFLYPAHVSRIELEAGEADWVYIRRRHNQLARERNEQVMPTSTMTISAAGIISARRYPTEAFTTTQAPALMSCLPTAAATT